MTDRRLRDSNHSMSRDWEIYPGDTVVVEASTTGPLPRVPKRLNHHRARVLAVNPGTLDLAVDGESSGPRRVHRAHVVAATRWTEHIRRPT